MRIDVEIRELVLTGFDKHDTAHIDQIIKNELARLIASDGLKNGMITGEDKFSMIDRDSFNLANGHVTSKSAGASIARSIYQAIGSTK